MQDPRSTPSEWDYQQLLHLISFVKHSIDRNLVYIKHNNPGSEYEFTAETFSDASFAPQADANPISGFTTYVNRNLVAWRSKKQKNITRSIAAEELVALVLAEDRTLRISEYIKSLGYKVTSIKLYEDNQAVLASCHDKSLSHTTELVDIGLKMIRERLTSGYYTLEYVNSIANIADMFTKALPPGSFNIVFTCVCENVSYAVGSGEDSERTD